MLEQFYNMHWYHSPANICWSARRFQDIFSVTIFHLPRRLADVLQKRLEDVLTTYWKTKNCYAEDVLKTSWRHVLKTSWRHVLKMSWRHVLKMSAKRLGDKQNVFWSYLYLTNLNVYLTNLVFHKSISDESKVNPKCIN